MKFIENLKKELSKTSLSAVEIEEIIRDYEEMVEEAISNGLKESELESKFGNVEKIVSELDVFKDSKEINEGRISFLPLENYDVSIELLNEEVQISSTDEEMISIVPKGVKNIKNYQITFNNNTLEIKREKESFIEIMIRKSKGMFIIGLPKAKTINKFKIAITNGDGFVKELKTEDFNLKSINGDFDLRSIKTNNFNIESVNGDMIICGIEALDSNLSTVSGDLEVEDLVVENRLNFNCVSGDCTIKKFSGKKMYLKTVSGDIDGAEINLDELTVHSVSGDVIINNQETDASIKHVTKSCLAGDIKIIS